MRVLAAVVGFIVFTAALMAGAWYFSTGGKATTVAPRSAPRVLAQAEDGDKNDDTATDTDTGAPEPLPALTIYRDGKPMPLAGPRSKPMLLHLWASWCGPCRAELPSLMAFAKKAGVELVAASVDDDFGGVVKFFGGKIPGEIAWDQKIVLERALGVENIPTTFLVDARGLVRLRLDGAQDWSDAGLATVIAKSSASP